MGNLKISANLFLEVAEQKRGQQFVDNWGYKRQRLSDTRKFGLVKDFEFPELGAVNREDCFYVAKAGTPFNDIIVNKGVAIDKFGEFIVNTDNQNITIPTDGLWRWIKIVHKLSNKELGTVSVDTFGNLTGLGTEFDKVLRGQDNFPSKIRFLNSTSGNGLDYEVSKVNSATSCILQGDFIAESNLQYAVVGTFTPGYPIPLPDQLIFNYDSVDIQLIIETSLNTRPAFLAGQEFYIARVRNNGITLQLEDKRIEWFWSQGEYLSQYLNRLTHINPLIGVEAVKYDVVTSPKNKNNVYLAWGFRFSSYTIDTSSKKISILIGNGGKYGDTSFFTTGDFNDWRLYSKNGNWQTIIDSQKSGTQIILTLDVLDIDEYGANDLLFIAPPFEEIEIKFSRDGSILDTTDVDGNSNFIEPFPYPLLEEIFNFNINTPLSKCNVNTLATCYNYNVTFRYKTFLGYTDWTTLPSNVIGYYNETSFDIYGNIKPNIIDRTLVPYTGHITNGFIRVCPSPSSYSVFQDLVLTGDLFGVEHKLIANSLPLLNLKVGLSRQYQIFDDIGSTLTLTGDSFIIINSLNASGLNCKNGNNFLIQFKQKINPASFKLRIVYNFINVVTYTLLKEFNAQDFQFIQSSEQGMRFRVTYDGTNWLIDNVNESKFNIKNNFFYQLAAGTAYSSGATFTQLNSATYTTPSDGITRKYNVFAKMQCDGSNGTASNNIQFKILDVTNNIDLDYSQYIHDKTVTTDRTFATISLMCQVTLAPNTVISIVKRWAQGGITVSNIKFIIEEIQ